MNLIYPATETHVRKHTDQRFHMVVETQSVYERITRPFIESVPREKTEWVDNILAQYVRVCKECVSCGDGSCSLA